MTTYYIDSEVGSDDTIDPTDPTRPARTIASLANRLKSARGFGFGDTLVISPDTFDAHLDGMVSVPEVRGLTIMGDDGKRWYELRKITQYENRTPSLWRRILAALRKVTRGRPC